MSLLGIALVFLVLGVILGVGAFLLVAGVKGLATGTRGVGVLSLVSPQNIGSYSLREISGVLARVLMVLVGLAMVSQSILWTYIAVWR